LEKDDYYSQHAFIFLQSQTISDFGIYTSFFFILLLLVCSAMISASEVAYFSLSQRIINRLKKSNSITDQRVAKLTDEPGILLATILIANNFINITIVLLSSFVLSNTIPTTLSSATQFLIEVVLVTFFIVLFGEISPKIYASSNNLSLARRMSRLILFLIRLIKPFSKLLVASTSYIEKKVSQKSRQDNTVSLEDIGQVIEITVNGNNEDTEQEKEMLKSIIQFGNVSAKQIMTARVNMTCIHYDSTFGELLDMAIASNYSRIPVYYDDSMDNIKGIVYIKDLLKYLDKNKDTFNWQFLIRQPYYVPETQRIDKLLEKFKKDRVHMAIVVDEYGGTAGIVTLEDILEEVIGDIKDEFDQDEDETTYKVLGENHYEFEAQTLIIDVCRVLDIDTNAFDEMRGDADSIAGLLLEAKKDFPENGEIITINHYEFKVVATTERRIEAIEVKKLDHLDKEE
jgi:putative hemolysin